MASDYDFFLYGSFFAESRGLEDVYEWKDYAFKRSGGSLL